MQTLRLPYPTVTTNNLFMNVKRGGRIKTPEYRAWIMEAGLMLNRQNPTKVKGPAKVIIVAIRPDKRKRDLDNLQKPILDLLVAHQVIEDDSLIHSLTTEWSSDNLSGVSVTIIPLERPSEAAHDP